MVFFIFLGLMDVLFAVLMLLTHFGLMHSWRMALAGAIFWIGKSIIFRGSFLSVLDFLAGIYFILVMLGVHTALVYLFLGIMIYKLIMSLVLRG
jgi:hypothetical protein